MFERARWASGYGIACGRDPMHLIGVDLDVKGGLDGVADLRALEAEHGFTVPVTATVATPSGGWHLWLATEPGTRVLNSVGRTRGHALGIDVRGTGGYLVGPGSLGAAGAYLFAPGTDPATVAPAPPELLAALTPAPAATAVPDPDRLRQQIHHQDAYTRAVLTREADKVRATTEGGRKNRLWASAAAVGRLVRMRRAGRAARPRRPGGRRTGERPEARRVRVRRPARVPGRRHHLPRCLTTGTARGPEQRFSGLPWPGPAHTPPALHGPARHPDHAPGGVLTVPTPRSDDPYDNVSPLFRDGWEQDMEPTAGPDAWDIPVPLGESRTLPAFPVDVLPPWVSDMVAAVAEETQTPADLAGCLALAALATAAAWAGDGPHPGPLARAGEHLHRRRPAARQPQERRVRPHDQAPAGRREAAQGRQRREAHRGGDHAQAAQGHCRESRRPRHAAPSRTSGRS